MSEANEGPGKPVLPEIITSSKRDIAKEILEAMTPKRTSMSGGEWNAGKRTYSIKDAKTGIITSYKLVFMGRQMQSGNAENVVTEYYQESVAKDGKSVRNEVVMDIKTGEWRKPTISDKIMKYAGALQTTGHVTEVRHADNTSDHRLEIVEHDLPVSQSMLIHV